MLGNVLFFMFHDLWIVDRLYRGSKKCEEFRDHRDSCIYSGRIRIVEVLDENNIHIHKDREQESQEEEMEYIDRVFLHILLERVQVIDRSMCLQYIPDIAEVQEKDASSREHKGTDRSIEFIPEEYESDTE